MTTPNRPSHLTPAFITMHDHHHASQWEIEIHVAEKTQMISLLFDTFGVFIVLSHLNTFFAKRPTGRLLP